MEFNYFKSSVMAAVAVGALVCSASAMAVTPSSILPAEGQVETLESFTLTFEEGTTVEWSVGGTQNTPYLTRNGEVIAIAGPQALVASGNQLFINFPDEFVRKGVYELHLAAGSYVVDGETDHDQLGEEITYTWDVEGILLGIKVEPETSVLTEIQNIRITFQDNDVITLTDNWSTTHGAILYLDTEEDGLKRRGTFMPQVAGNTLLLTMNEPIIEPGDYKVEIHSDCVLVDGTPYSEPININYTVVEPEYPTVDLSVTPAVNVLETLEDVEITFGGVDIVVWNVNESTDKAPYLATLDGTRMATFTKLGGEGNMLSLGLLSEFAVKGEYNLVIPEGSYAFGGSYHMLPGKEIVLNFEILGLGGISVEPALNVINEIQNIKITFNEAQTVTVADDLGTLKTPYLVKVVDNDVESGDNVVVRERRGTFLPQAAGNNLLLTMNEPIYEPGEYVVIVPANTYFLDGAEGFDVEIAYTVVGPSYPEVELSVNPATDIVETLETVELTFGGVDIVMWDVNEQTDKAPYLEDLDGNRMATFAKLGGEGNMLSLSLFDEFDVKGLYNLVIPEGSYVFGGSYHSMPGNEIVLNFEVLGYGGYSVEPAMDIVPEIQNVKITFNDARVVTLAEDLGTTNTPYLVIVNEEGVRERRGTFMPQVAGNNMLLTMNVPITEEGEYVVIIPGTTYFLDGNPGEDVEIYYNIAGDGKEKNYTVDPIEGNVEELHTIAITFNEAEDIVFWNMEALNANTVEYPSINCDGANVVALDDVYSQKKTLYLAPTEYQAFTANGWYVVTIPAGSYCIDGVDGQEIVLNYIIEKTAVDAIFGEKANMDVYDINGRVILRGADAQAVKSLRGIFVIDGKKYILR